MLCFAFPAFCCTSVIVSGKRTHDGRPVMLKHRDTDELNNRIARFEGEKYGFIGLVNYDSKGGSVWAGTNSAGFCIMNTATYDLKDDDIPDSEMDCEDRLMYRALEVCGSVAEFEHYLDTLTRPMHVEANFGVIDAHGGAAYFEVNNFEVFKFNVNDCPSGYRVVTNFTESGRVADRKGVDRYEKACSIMPSVIDGVDHRSLINSVSRSGAPILRNITSAAIVFEGVREGENPLHTVMWTALGYPVTTPYFPLMVMDEDVLPAFVKRSSLSRAAPICEISLTLKMDGADALSSCRKIEETIDMDFARIYDKWVRGEMDTKTFKKKYSRFSDNIFKRYLSIIGKLAEK